MKKVRIAIIGGGPAGIAAAIQLKRYGLEPVFFEPGRIGGLIHNAWRVENYPGFPEGISGPDLAELLNRQFESFDIVWHKVKIERLDFNDAENTFTLHTPGESFSAEIVIVASGTKPIKMPILETAEGDCGGRIYYEVYPLLDERNRKIVIIGAGDAAFDYAMSLATHNEVIILNRTDRISALPRLQAMVKENDRITYCENIKLIRVGKNRGNKIEVSLAKFDDEWLMEVDYVLVAVGREPNRDFYSDYLLKRETDLVNKGLLYLAGDVKNDRFRQVAISVGDGVRAAMEIYFRIQQI
jgi:thioredoxin reductase (NADPH)